MKHEMVMSRAQTTEGEDIMVVRINDAHNGRKFFEGYMTMENFAYAITSMPRPISYRTGSKL